MGVDEDMFGGADEYGAGGGQPVGGHSPTPDGPFADPSGTGPAGHLWVSQGPDVWDLGPADLDTDADGIADSLTRPGPDGMAVYTDSDADGRVDLITEVGRDGSYTTQRLDTGSGTWRSTDTGRLA
ncbi:MULTISPECIES: DUF6802 family protein [Gordonia]|jgi:hypothetical protein|uniref:DUF6802 family protein n=1 Tax=Gordonia TaxID=2053 RepID=UPI001FEAAD08|nr:MULTISPECIES: DUF6802 family protein [Gordonia]